MEPPGCFVLMLLFVAAFIVPTTNISAYAIDSETMRIAMAETEVEHEEYEYDREEAGADINSPTESDEEADQKEVGGDSVEEEEEPEFEDYEEDPSS